MTLDVASGVWSYTAPTGALRGKYYLYEARVYVRANNRVETNIVTDPYSVSLARNSTRGQIVSGRTASPSVRFAVDKNRRGNEANPLID